MRMREQKRNYPEKVLWHMAKQRAKRKHIPFSITPDDIHIPRTCPLLGILLKVGQGTPNDSSPSLDRIIPSEGYTPKNIQVISYRANRLKADASIPEMETLLKNWRKIEDSRGNTDMAVSLQAVFAARKNEEDA
jgi:hypothetical protein